MFDPAPYLWLIPILPLAASMLTAFLGPPLLRQQSHWPCILATFCSCALSLWVLAAVAQGSTEIRTFYAWFQAGSVDVGFTLRADGLTAVMLVTVTFISGLIVIYSAGYMHGDAGYSRYFAEMALFIFSMTGLVLADNFLLLYAFWEGVGLCSYLLIGFWFTRPSAADAARKAFLVTRLGDIGFLIGILVIWAGFHAANDPTRPLYAVDFQKVFGNAASQDTGLLLTVCLLLFCGAVGKSAQFPLHVWLPDAMEGPTPVSALIHAATMVTAGVYMVARCTPLFVEAPGAQLVVACIGGFTALLAALIALTQNDLKRVLAYSTISQLGYMFLALGSATLADMDRPNVLVTAAVVAAIFHLFTHAFFKALLFLAAGSVMHAMGNVIDMRRFGGLRYALPVTRWTFLCGAASLAAFPLLSGFWSKDDILSAVSFATEEGHPNRAAYVLLLVTAMFTAGLTAFYTFRVYFLTFSGELRTPPEAGDHVHESPPVMLGPMIILAIGAVLIGIMVEPFTHWFSLIVVARTPSLTTQEQHVFNWPLVAGSTGIALSGIALAWFMYVFQPGSATKLAARMEGLYQLSLNKFYLDELYDFFIVRPMVLLAAVARIFDLYILDGLVDLIGHVPRFVGLVFRPIQNGLAQFYALAMALGMVVFLLALVWRFTG
jgi:NADH-quinone oxidoreductase subunit L